MVNKNSVKSLFKVASYTGRGVIYNIVVKDSTNKMVTMAAYIPIVTYACDLLNSSSCDMIGEYVFQSRSGKFNVQL